MRQLSIYSGLLPIICFLIFYKRNKGNRIWVIFIYTILSFLSDKTLVYFPSKEYPILKFTIYCIFTIVEYALFTIYIYIIVKGRYLRYLMIFLSIIFCCVAAYNYYINVGKIGFDSISASIESILIIAYCIFFLFEQLNAPTTPVIYESYQFWLIIGFLLYLSGELFFFIYASSFTEKDIGLYWNINYGVNILKNLLFTLAFYMNKDISNQSFMRKPYNI